MKVLHFMFFIGDYGFLYKARWQMRAHLKQVVDESCNNARSCNMITMSSFKLAKFVNEENQ
jgi:hypothetical protein